jgi:hypothetical protein
MYYILHFYSRTLAAVFPGATSEVFHSSFAEGSNILRYLSVPEYEGTMILREVSTNVSNDRA